jgi:hypothetical protein
MKEKFIKIPADFKSLQDLKELVSNYDFLSRLTNSLNGYQRHYIISYLMSLDEILEYIPEDHYKDYTVFKRDDRFEKYGIKNLNKLLNEAVPEEEKIFLLNTTDKKIDICYWAAKDPNKWREGRSAFDIAYS